MSARISRLFLKTTIIFIITVFFIEIGFRIFVNKQIETFLAEFTNYKTPDTPPRAPVSRLYLPNLKIEHTGETNGSKNFDVKYSFDKYGRRNTPISIQGTEHLIFFGCSFMFGFGVNDNEIIPY